MTGGVRNEKPRLDAVENKERTGELTKCVVAPSRGQSRFGRRLVPKLIKKRAGGRHVREGRKKIRGVWSCRKGELLLGPVRPTSRGGGLGQRHGEKMGQIWKMLKREKVHRWIHERA